MKISFIVPVYNVEAYLEECVESIVRQCNEECEVILVDDGAKDRSGALCDAAAEKYPIVRVIHKENGGLSSARNAGLEIATGDYIAFVDSDDRIAEGSVAEMLRWIDQGGADLCFLEAIKFFPDGRQEPLGDQIEKGFVEGRTKAEVLAYIASRPKYPGSACTKMYRRAYMERNGLRFPSDRRHSEDLGFVLRCLLKAESFDVLEMPYYEYRQDRDGSITHVVTKKSFVDLGMFVTETSELLTENRQPKDEVSRSLMSTAAYEYSIMLWHYSCLPKADQPEALTYLRENRWVLGFGATRKIKAIHALTQVCGLRATSALLNVYMSRR